MADYLAALLEWIRGQGALGPAVLGAVYAVATVLLIPGSVLTTAAGFLFGVPVGFVTVLVGSNLGAAAAFLLGRTLARGWIERRAASRPRFQAIDRAIGEHGFKIVLLLRLSPVFPFTFLNYALGLTRVSVRGYLLATAIGMIPGILLYVYLGSLVQSLADLLAGRVEGGPGQRALFYTGLAATVLVTIYITRLARRALAAAAPGMSKD